MDVDSILLGTLALPHGLYEVWGRELDFHEQETFWRRLLEKVIEGQPFAAIGGTVKFVPVLQPAPADDSFRKLLNDTSGISISAGVRRRTVAGVLHARKHSHGCCDRYGDQMACDCLQEAAGYDEWVKAGQPLLGGHP